MKTIAQVTAHGSTRVLKIKKVHSSELESNTKEAVKQLGKKLLSNRPKSLNNNNNSHNNEEDDEEMSNHMTCVLQLAGIGLSIVDEIPQELLFVTLQRIYLKYTNSPKQTTMELSLKNLQIDNQLYFTPFPVLLQPTEMGKEEQQDDNWKFFHLSLIRDNQHNKDIGFYPYFSVLFQEMDLSVDASVVNHVLKMQVSKQNPFISLLCSFSMFLFIISWY